MQLASYIHRKMCVSLFSYAVERLKANTYVYIFSLFHNWVCEPLNFVHWLTLLQCSYTKKEREREALQKRLNPERFIWITRCLVVKTQSGTKIKFKNKKKKFFSTFFCLKANTNKKQTESSDFDLKKNAKYSSVSFRLFRRDSFI